MLIIKFFIVLVMAFIMGKIVTKFKIPAILGWLLAGMALGPHAFGLMGESLLAADWYKMLLSLLECSVGLMIGTELVLKDLKKSGKQLGIEKVVLKKKKMNLHFEFCSYFLLHANSYLFIIYIR